ncbi:MAG: Hsp70 family protein, partial [Treponema sp.]|nr:Hsp70 family protein [Treponema sp.]
MASSIGIKIANGEFYPLVEENSLIKKRLVLTTVHDDQPSVQIDLYRSPVQAMSEAQYIGTVVVEKIKPRPKGEPSIEMIISSDKNGNIIADAIDLDTGAGGEHYVLTVSLQSMDDLSRDINIPDFELEASEEPPSGLYQHAKQIREKQKKKPKPALFILIGIVLLLGLLAAWLFFFNGLETIQSLGNRLIARIQTAQTQPEPVRQPEPAVTAADPVRQTEPVTIVEPARQAEPAA